MTWPPPDQNNGWTNASVQEDLHPTAHNDVANTLKNDFAPQITLNKDAAATNAAAIAAHRLLYTDAGELKGPTPAFWSDANIQSRTAAGAFLGAFDGYISQSTDQDTTTTFIDVSSGWVTTGASVVIDLSTTPKAVVIQTQSAFVGIIEPGGAIATKIGYSVDGAPVVQGSSALQGKNFNSTTENIRTDTHSLPQTIVFAASALSVTIFCMAQASGGITTVQALDKRVTALRSGR